MDRQFVYSGQIPLETDLLSTNRNMMIALGKLCGALFGTGGMVNGLAVSPNSPAALNVLVAPGEIYSLQNVDNTPYSSLPADTTDTIVKQGIQLAKTQIACPAPSTAGFSINYLIQATYQDVDTGLVTLPYYNASNPSQAYAGPGNSGAQQATVRQGVVSAIAKAGIAGTTGTQTTPAPDAGYVALAVVTVANGQTTITTGNIVASTGAQIIGNPLTQGRLLNTQVFNTAGTFTYNPTPGTRYIEPEGGGGGAAGGGAAITSSSQISGGGGGGSGGYVRGIITSSFAGATVVVGAGGAGSAGANGGNGGASTFGAVLTAPGGGGGGSAAAASALPALTGYGMGGAVGTGGSLINAAGGFGGTSFGSSIATAISGSGGQSFFGGGGNAIINTSTAGNPGQSPGSGGSGALAIASNATARAGGNGAPGIWIIREYA